MQQESIKSYLHLLGMQDSLNHTAYNSQLRSPRRNSYIEDLSDWNNQKEQFDELGPSGSSLPKLFRQKNLHSKSRSNSMDEATYNSCLLRDIDSHSRRKEQSMFINPVVIKFNTQLSRNNLRKSSLLFHKILHEKGDRKGEDPSQLRQFFMKLQPTKHEEKIVALSPPKTQRCSGILRMLKRREQTRIMKKKKNNPEALTAIKLKYR